MVWLLRRNEDLLTCEIRQAPEAPAYEFEIARRRGGRELLRFASPTALIDNYLRLQSALRAHGWRPCVQPMEPRQRSRG